MLDSRPTKIKIKLKNLINNVNVIKKLVGNELPVLAVVKANAYGHGSVEIAKELKKKDIDFFGVACAYEADKLFKSGISCKILSLGKIYREDIELADKYPYRLTVSSIEDLYALSDLQGKFKVHLKFDTGMGRCGFFFDKVKFVIDFLKEKDNITVEGIFTHFPVADKDTEFTQQQIIIFNKIREMFKTSGYNNILYHTANSDGIINFKSSYFNLVRPGLLLYGSYWNKSIKKSLGFKPVMEFISKITDIKIFKCGDTIGYGRTYTVSKENIKAAIVPVGYADGYSRGFSNRGYVLINGKLCKILGRISMDWMVVDVTDLEDVTIGTTVILFGDDDFKADVDDLAKAIDTISYEILCSAGKNYRKEVIYDKCD